MNYQMLTPIMFYIILVLGTFYFMLYRPQKKNKEKVVQMQRDIQIGDEIITVGGMLGKVVEIDSDVISIELTDDKKSIRFVRSAIQKNLSRD